MSNKFKYGARWVTANELRKLKALELKKAQAVDATIVEPVVEDSTNKVEDIQVLRDRYEEAHPEKREVPGNMRNNVDGS